MAEGITEEDVWKIIAKVKHPTINCPLVDLGMIKGIKFKGNKAIVTLAFLSPGTDTITKLARIVKEPMEELGFEVEFIYTLMNKDERATFFKKGRETRGGL